MALPDRPADRHRQVAQLFTERVGATRHWDVPAPVADWTARDVVRHLVDWSTGFLAGGAGINLDHGPSLEDDPAAGWLVHCRAIQHILDDPTESARQFSNPYTGELPLDRAINRFYTNDVFMHTWDLARATGQNDRLDPDTCASLLTEMVPIEQLMRSSGQFGPPCEVPPDADTQTRLLGFIGRNPFWTPGKDCC